MNSSRNSPRKVTIGVCGGVAAYKAAELIRDLQKSGLDVHVVMTRAAEEFVRPLTFASLTGNKVITSLWETQVTTDPEAPIEHIAEAQSTDLLIVAPATAHTLAKFANGLADDFLSTLYLATTAPVLVAPAMNVNMWNHPATRANLETLRARGVHIIEPGAGYLACGMTGGGRLADIPEITAAALAILQPNQTLANQTVLITAGGTREPIDPVRFIGNRSSGRMGYALAEAALARGARVILISAPTSLPPPQGSELIPVTTAAEMRDAVLAQLPQANIVIKAAAVSDFRPRAVADNKLKRTGNLTLELEPTEDIVQLIAERRNPNTLVIAFAAETAPEASDLLARARSKLLRKGVDAIVANNVSDPTIGFDSTNNAAWLLTPTDTIELPHSSKLLMAQRILDHILTLDIPIHFQSIHP
jgi:phosphopantothenoylcysteine decarboxylase / phosphopantothenate---cysteine ligase